MSLDRLYQYFLAQSKFEHARAQAHSEPDLFWLKHLVSEMLGPDADANARLIAAAPDLLAALKEIAEGKGAYSPNPLEHAANCIEDMKAIARTAIAKAEGKGE